MASRACPCARSSASPHSRPPSGCAVVAPTGASAAPAHRNHRRGRPRSPTLRVGSAGALVADVQRILAIRRSGVFDRATAAAVRAAAGCGSGSSRPTGVVTRQPRGRCSGTPRSATPDAHVARGTRPAAAFAAWQASVHGRGIVYRESKLSARSLSRSGRVAREVADDAVALAGQRRASPSPPPPSGPRASTRTRSPTGSGSGPAGGPGAAELGQPLSPHERRGPRPRGPARSPRARTSSWVARDEAPSRRRRWRSIGSAESTSSMTSA